MRNLASEVGAATATRILEWEGCLNVRDIGGLPTADGRSTRSGSLVRSDVLCRLTPLGQQALRAYGVRTIVDVRTPAEVARDWTSYPFRDELEGEVRYRNVPFTSGRDELAWQQMHAAYAAAGSREELNRLDLDGHAAGISAIVRAIATAEPGGVLIHCHAGKDRTGLVVALLLSLVGVTDEDVADDYALTMASFEQLIADWLTEMSDDPREHQRLRRLAEPRREAMLDTLQYLRRRYGSAEAYLLTAGLRPEELAQLRERLLE